jgi:diaminopimelate decarboxylase
MNQLAGIEGSAFLYDLDALAKRAAQIRAAVPRGVELYYACKANPLSHVIRTLAEAGYGFDVASAGELRQVKKISPKNPMLVTGPVKTRSFFEECLKLGVRRFVLESQSQLENLEGVAAAMEIPVEALLRLQLDWKEGSSVLGGSAVTAFGLDAEAWLAAKREFRFVKIMGVHVFQWGNESSIERLEKIWTRVLHEAKDFSNRMGFRLSCLDLGGGLGIPYQNETREITPEAFAAVLRNLQIIAGDAQLLLELGRYLVGPCGTYLTKIADRKKLRGVELLLTEGGTHHLLRSALVGQSFPANLLRESCAPLQNFQVHGPLCTALDKQGTFQLPNDVKVGDQLIFRQTGAYGFTESMPYFLCHEGAAEYVIQNGEMRLARAAQKPETWLL